MFSSYSLVDNVGQRIGLQYWTKKQLSGIVWISLFIHHLHSTRQHTRHLPIKQTNHYLHKSCRFTLQSQWFSANVPVTAEHDILGSNPTVGNRIHHESHRDMQIWTWTTQADSAFYPLRDEKWVSVFELRNIKWQRWVQIIAAYRQSQSQVVWLGLRVGNCLALF